MSDRPRHVLWWAALPVGTLLLLSMSLRAPIVVVAPLLGEIRADLGLSAATAGLLTSIPVLCFGLITPLASQLLRRIGINHAVVYCLLGIAVGSAVRSSGSIIGAFAGTFLIGAAVTIGNTAVPMLIGRQYQRHAALLTGAYTASVNVGVTTASAFAAPIAERAGWQASLALWGITAAAIVVVWWVIYPPGMSGPRIFLRQRAGLDATPFGRTAVPQAPAATAAQPGPRQRRVPAVWRWPVAWLLAASFAGHTLGYYAITSWLPSYLADVRDMSVSGAGYASSLFQAIGIIGPMLVPALSAALGMSTRRMMWLLGGCWVALPLGLVLAPQWWALWSVVGGVAQGGWFTVIMLVIIRRSRSVDENRRLTTMVQTIGYTVAATGPVLMGWLHDALGLWQPALLVVAAMLVMMTACGVLAVRDTSTPDDGASAGRPRPG